ncbi:uncharacterized protein H6S33_003711 [Morchella sextelata]|uniref:uncharacterized protein n=1 Tax=Morchella sextelata TaxID=1174677 RepID=UPI001D04BA42|nr:uncharacterized protein H6S33_003711 [Morchella sextelata]KAH0606877.1 hypothetical protein H6S33_003711 [Morchella sextelata]
MAMRKRELLQRLLDDESRKYEGKDTDKANLLLDLVAQFVLVEPKVESIAAGDMDNRFKPCQYSHPYLKATAKTENVVEKITQFA